ncbi:MAG: BREX-1 system adenine-specific DNA-methyltransferase PglX, partial [Cetobacterium sp.]|uniref:BREX-1 system adenine-specific DNA-methyltransferase PglX n=1 Tax=Cetobacterium sp. TaxID=2071632 RepID=UPI003EE515ED
EQTRKLIGDNSLNNLLKLISNFEDAKEYGSILKLDSLEKGSLEEELHKLEVAYKNLGQIALFAGTWNMEEDLETLRRLITQQENMTQKYDVVITNPPYMGSKGYSDILKKYIEKNYKDSKADLFAVFMEKSFELSSKYSSLITMESWMFLSSFEKLRKDILENKSILNMIHMPYLGKGGTSLGINFGTSAFIFENNNKIRDGFYQCIRYYETDNNGVPKEFPVKNERLNITNQKDFEKIPGSPIAYWVSERVKEIFEVSKKMLEIGDFKQGIATGDNDKFLREWFEISYSQIGFGYKNISEFISSKKKYCSYNKGGAYRKWYGNQENIIKFDEKNYDLLKTSGNKLPSKEYYFREGITWGKVSSALFSMRYSYEGEIFSDAGMKAFIKKEKEKYILGFYNSKIIKNLMEIISPTINFEKGNIEKLPYVIPKEEKKEKYVNDLTNDNIEIAKQEWNSRETSWDFERLELVQGDSLESSYEKYCESWKDKFFKMHKNEEELNKMFIEIYGLEDEMDEKVNLADITLLKKEANIVDGELVFNIEELMKQFLSYAVGCIMGRYSIDKPGLIIANSDDVMKVENNKIVIKSKEEEIRHEITNPRFIPDAHGIVPVLKEDSFENDIVSRVIEFVKAVYGEDALQENLNFIAEGLGKKSGEDAKNVIRKYFIKDFYKDHLQRYKKRPIYWMMNSGKKDAFSTLIYLHRYE